MKGTRPLNNAEIRRVSACFTGTFEVRNRGLFMLGVSTGGRISWVPEVSRAVPINRDGKEAIGQLVR